MNSPAFLSQVAGSCRPGVPGGGPDGKSLAGAGPCRVRDTSVGDLFPGAQDTGFPGLGLMVAGRDAR
ncbi:MAG: hypothetical protein ACYCYA_02825 [Actinomycetes bacterium]